MMLVLEDQQVSSISSTWEPCSAFFQPFWCHPRKPTNTILVFGGQTDILNLVLFPIQVPNSTSSNCLSDKRPAGGCPYKFRSRGTTGSSMFDIKFGHVSWKTYPYIWTSRLWNVKQLAKWTFFSLCASRTFLLFTLSRFHARNLSSFSTSLSTDAFASGFFIAWSIGKNLCTKLQWVIEVNRVLCTKNCSDLSNWTLSTRCDLHDFLVEWIPNAFSFIHELPQCTHASSFGCCWIRRSSFPGASSGSLFTFCKALPPPLELPTFSLRFSGFFAFSIFLIDEINASQLSSTIELWFLVRQILLFFLLRCFSQVRPNFRPQIIRSGLTLHNNFWSLDRCVSLSVHLLSRTGMETGVSVTVGFCLGLALAMGFSETVSSSSSARYSSTFTILTQEAVLSWNRDRTWVSILYRSSW